jgi:hypothetical protein
METARAGPIASTSWRDYSTTGDSRRYRDERQIEREALEKTSRQAATHFPTAPATAVHFLANHLQFRADLGDQVTAPTLTSSAKAPRTSSPTPLSPSTASDESHRPRGLKREPAFTRREIQSPPTPSHFEGMRLRQHQKREVGPLPYFATMVNQTRLL